MGKVCEGKVVIPGKLVRIVRNTFTGELLLREKYDEKYEPLDLVCDSATKVVYYKFTRKKYISNNDDKSTTKVGYMSQFLGPNGRYCCFVNGQIHEMEEGGKTGEVVIPGELVRILRNIFSGALAIKEKFDVDYEPSELVCDTTTKVVYYMFTSKKHVRHNEEIFAVKVAHMATFLGPNGKACRFADGQIYEII